MRWTCTLLVACALVACAGREPYRCADSSQCVAQGVDGVCETTGFCSFPDSSCPGGRKYEDRAGDGLAGTCIAVEEPMPDAGICGVEGEACCAGEPACGANLTCTDGTCTSCVQDIAFGRRFSCVVRRDNTVWCVGDNTHGQLGFGLTSTTPNLEWMQVRELETSVPIDDATTVAAGFEHACAIRAGGAVWCWGRNHQGQLGRNDTEPAAAAVAVLDSTTDMPLGNIVQITAGDDHTCARSAGGAVWCWGRNNEGQVGDGTAVVMQPRAVAVLDAPGGMPVTDVVEVTSASDHNCLRKQDGTTLCWGRNTSGELGDMSEMSRFTPVPVGMSKSIDAGSWAMTCRVNMDDTASCTGSTWRSRLGVPNDNGGEPNNVTEPVAVLQSRGGSPLANVKQIVVGGVPCALLGDSTVRCWGDNTHGQTGTGGGQPFPAPVLLADNTPLDRVKRLVGHFSHLCAFRQSGEIVCWGRGVHGEFGNGIQADVGHATPLSFTCP